MIDSANALTSGDDGYLQDMGRRLAANVGRVIVGKEEVVELALVALLCEGHVLIEDVPGIGKTTLAKCLARSLGCSFQRIQFTPDLLPSDIIGINFFNQKLSEFEYRPGPLMAQVVLADEINRATPRTQSALLEAMEERQITVDGVTRGLPRPFVGLATQNPIELEGTFPLPEAQLDRFMIRLRLGYPDEREERAILARFAEESPLDSLEPVVDAAEMTDGQRRCRRTQMEASVQDYLVGLVRATRTHPATELGGSPRASLALFHTAQALAALRGRSYAIPDDVKLMAPYVLNHRLILTGQARLRGITVEAVMAEVLDTVPVPV